mmetsp:Transcript_58459/g.115911  ORF Transcript_58459/g.115911 Transcript_58459/m.115911 type:complete len:236 (-) Transcript_58459:1423-2130(-)
MAPKGPSQNKIRAATRENLYLLTSKLSAQLVPLSANSSALSSRLCLQGPVPPCTYLIAPHVLFALYSQRNLEHLLSRSTSDFPQPPQAHQGPYRDNDCSICPRQLHQGSQCCSLQAKNAQVAGVSQAWPQEWRCVPAKQPLRCSVPAGQPPQVRARSPSLLPCPACLKRCPEMASCAQFVNAFHWRPEFAVFSLAVRSYLWRWVSYGNWPKGRESLRLQASIFPRSEQIERQSIF